MSFYIPSLQYSIVKMKVKWRQYTISFTFSVHVRKVSTCFSNLYKKSVIALILSAVVFCFTCTGTSTAAPESAVSLADMAYSTFIILVKPYHIHDILLSLYLTLSRSLTHTHTHSLTLSRLLRPPIPLAFSSATADYSTYDNSSKLNMFNESFNKLPAIEEPPQSSWCSE